MKSFPCMIAIASLLILLAQPASAQTTYINENWETETPSANWPCKNPPSGCGTSFNGWFAQDYSCENSG
ncbi:MAG: hypothetical protein MUP55_00005, partial [Candidatus Aenigmarchaeota archaeon]|nr:hypothetical protein [Candidatus Aenigmarchaeota archaeon]